ncbi:unnamed protein product [Aphanomyces euteiches]|uniref:Uncharacterized protein n=1 Tax=Aphanomyces euteiches TaxID=100861 RepID=A0A6G0W8W6_9STRA|nr:hypothetical protein Ae201684_018337 [Aphanomyces euteiches]KAH9082986.1 hypothetical protein Ae201684P_013889 [Aphanomyces euteiches]KAH9137362.1 hypothetical protein AeRB84_017912 [Aphanomyces euteiches]
MQSRRAIAALAKTKVLLVEGKDSAKFLQGIFTNDINALNKRGDTTYGAFLTHKGRVVSDAQVIHKDADSFFVTFDEAVEEDLIKYMKKYKLRSKVAMTPVDDQFRVHTVLPSSFVEQDPTISSWTQEQSAQHPDAIVYQDPRSALFGVRAILPFSATLSTPSDHDVVNETFVHDHEIVLGACGGLDLRDGIPLEYNLDLLHGIALRKGCYVGQELISRTHYKGNIRKRIVPFVVLPLDHPHTAGDVRFTFGDDANKGPDSWTSLLASSGSTLETGQKLLLDSDKTKSVGKVVASASGLNAAVGMLRLDYLKDAASVGKIVTEDGLHQVVPFTPAWWPLVNPETGKPSSA